MIETKNKGLLWVDCIGGLLAGSLVLPLSHMVASWDGLPQGVIIFTGAANLIYGCFSLNLALREKRSMTMISILAWANMFWLLVCCLLTATWWSQISLFGIVHLIGEGIYVAGLGAVEWHNRESLTSA